MDYIRTKIEKKLPQLLQVRGEGGAYRMAILHASLREERATERYRPASEHSHDIYHFVLYVGGENVFRWQGKEHEGRRGVLALVGPGESHDFGPAVKGAFAYTEVTFQLEREGELLGWPSNSSPP